MVDILSGHNIPHSLTPIYRKPAGGGSFFSGDFVLYDQVLESISPGVSKIFVRFVLGPNPTDGVVRWRGPIGGLDIPIATVPLQWWKDLPTPPNPPVGSAVRRINDQGPDIINAGDLIAIDTWFGDGLRDAWLELPPFGETRENTSTYEMAKWADTSVIFARADITLRHKRIV